MSAAKAPNESCGRRHFDAETVARGLLDYVIAKAAPPAAQISTTSQGGVCHI